MTVNNSQKSDKRDLRTTFFFRKPFFKKKENSFLNVKIIKRKLFFSSDFGKEPLIGEFYGSTS